MKSASKVFSEQRTALPYLFFVFCFQAANFWEKLTMEQVMKYHIIDFFSGRDNAKFGTTFHKLIDGLELFCK
jgi:hypothetical protein